MRLGRLKRVLVSAVFIVGFITPVGASSYYSDPLSGSMSNDGSEGSPWGNLAAIFNAKKRFSAGDEIILLNGAHGAPYITGTHTDYVTLKPYPGHTPKIASVQLEKGSYWAFDGLTFTSDGSGGIFSRDYMISTKDDATYLKVVNCRFYSAESSANWSKADWYTYAEDAVIIRGDHTLFSSNTLENTYFALQIEGDYAEVKHNLIDNFGADGLRVLGSHAVYEGNVIRDAYVEDYGVNHDDGIQMYDKDNVAGGVIDDVMFRNNIIMNFADPITQTMIDDHLVGYSMQGIIVTDGHIENSVFENNLVIGDHYHGITLSGPINCRIQNNTVMKTPASVNPIVEAFPWIQLDESKNHIHPSNCVIRNNISSKLTPWTYENGSNITAENNLEPATNEYVGVFTDYAGFDFTLPVGSPAVDVGANTALMATDLAGNPRLVGSAVDCGAYELQAIDDTTPPEISDAADSYLYDEVVVIFNESITAVSAENVNHYLIDGGVMVSQARLAGDRRTVTLRTSALSGGVEYTVFADGVEDFYGNSSSNVSARFTYLCGTNWAGSFQDDEFGTNPPEHAFDDDFSTKWAVDGTAWIQKSFCRNLMLRSVDMAFSMGDQRRYSFTIEVSTDGRTFTEVFSGQSSGSSLALENFDFEEVSAKQVKITGFGNDQTGWNNFAEIRFQTTDPARVAYDEWIETYPGVGDDTDREADPDQDQLNNLGEWAMGGNPDDAADRGLFSALERGEESGTNGFEVVYAKRRDADEFGLSYLFEQTTDLVGGSWSNAIGYVIGVGDLGGEYQSVTNRMRVGAETQEFFRVLVFAGEWKDAGEPVEPPPVDTFSIVYENNNVAAGDTSTAADSMPAHLAAGSLTLPATFPPSNWPNALTATQNSAAIDSLISAIYGGEYFSFTITPDAGLEVSYSSLFVRTSMGANVQPAESTFTLMSSLTGFNAADALVSFTSGTVTASSVNQNTLDLSAIAELQNIAEGTAIEFRLYVHNTGANPMTRIGIGHLFNTSNPDDDLRIDGQMVDVGP